MAEIAIQGTDFILDGELTYQGRIWNGHRIEGLLLNTRMVQATFDDANPESRALWAYPDTGTWDPDRNVQEFVQALPVYRQHGVLAVTLNLQGGNPQGYRRDQPWMNTAFLPDGSLKERYMARLEQALGAADALGMAVILGIYYFGQDQRLQDEAAVVCGLENAVEWVLAKGYRNVLIEVNNECDVPKYVHEILMPGRVHELIERARAMSLDGQRLLVGTSFRGRAIPVESVVRCSDFLLLHGNGVSDPNEIVRMVDQTRQVPGYRPMPILFNEDDHFDFEAPWYNFRAAISARASWGILDIGENNYRDGFQSPPVNWGLSTDRKRGFFELARQISGV